jgi:penicillin-binding protein 2
MLWRRIKKIALGARNKRSSEIYPDEIFLDSRNLPNLDTHQFEGRFERPIGIWSMRVMMALFLLIGALFGWKAWLLQIVNGEEYLEQSENNRLRHVEFFAERGIIYDRNGKELAWNDYGDSEEFALRKYIDLPGFAHILGYVNYPLRDTAGFYFRTAISGQDGIEKAQDDLLRGRNGVRVVEINALGEVQSASVLSPPQDGKNINLTIDADVQSAFYTIIADTAQSVGFRGGAGAIMNITNGDLLALVSYPEFNSDILSNQNSAEKISEYQNNVATPFLNRPLSGLYSPGSIVKPFMALAALQEGVVTPETSIFSGGSLEVANPYDRDNPTIFKDWRAHGLVDLRHALAVSSNVYFYQIGGGYGARKGLGIARIEQYMREFGFGSLTGIDLFSETAGTIPTPEWKSENFDDKVWRIGDTYNTAIGQYGFQVTPIQAVRAVASIGNGGHLLLPRIVKNEKEIGLLSAQGSKLDISHEHFDVVKQGMRMAVEQGTAKGLYMNEVELAAKTGTAQIGHDYVNSWIIGFFPYQDPKFAFVVTMERGPVHNLIGGVSVMRRMMEWFAHTKPEYIR